MAYFPLFVEISKKKCLVVGGGQRAFEKVAALFEIEKCVSYSNTTFQH